MPPASLKTFSIHALLAESDGIPAGGTGGADAFLSTLSLRRATRSSGILPGSIRIFYPRSPCGERRLVHITIDYRTNFSIHALLAESDCGPWSIRPIDMAFLSTLSLRRATGKRDVGKPPPLFSIHALLAESDGFSRPLRATKNHFYPRSPCGERHIITGAGDNAVRISIHALLAESDEKPRQTRTDTSISIHALLAESDD